MPEQLLLPLTTRQKEVFEIVHRSIFEKRFPPTIPEIQKDTGLENPGLVFKALKALEDKGYISKAKGKHRGIRLTDAGAEFVNGRRQLNLNLERVS